VPLIAADAGAATSAADELRKTAGHLDDLAGQARGTGGPSGSSGPGALGPRTHPELRRVAATFKNINTILARAVKARSVTAAQQRAIAQELDDLADALRKRAP
jgi:hypothetical protein